LIKNHEKIKDGTYGTKYSLIYESLKTDKLETLLLNSIMITRRIIFGVSVVLLSSSPYILVIINSISSLTIWYFILFFKPYQSKLDNRMNLYIEVNTFLILSVIGAFIYEDLPTSLYDTIEWTLVVLIYMIVMVPTLVNIVLLIHNIIMKTRRPNREKRTIDISASRGEDIEAINQNI
jgi:hypothetical protein